MVPVRSGAAFRRAAVLVLVLVVVACAPGGSESGRNGAPVGAAATASPRTVVLVTIEAIRPDLLSTYGGGVASPAFDRLASAGVVFEDAVSPCPMARPALVATLTGVPPDRSGVLGNAVDRLPADVVTLQAAFHAAGYATGAFVTSFFSSYASGLDRGFDLFDGPEWSAVAAQRFFPPIRPAEEATSHLAEWLAAKPKDARLFAWIHFADLHGLAVDETVETARSSYEAALRKVDAALGKVLDAIRGSGREGDAEIVVAGTHGQLLGEGGRRGDAYWLQEETLRVPLIWAGTRAAALAKASRRDARPVWLPDVAATLAEVAGKPLAPASEGTSLATLGTAPRKRHAWTWAPDDELAWPTDSAVKDPSGWRSTSGSSRTEERPAVPRPRQISAATRSRIERAGVRLGKGATSPSVRPRDADPILETVTRIRRFSATNHPLKAIRAINGALSSHPDNLAVLVARVETFVDGLQGEPAVPFAERLLDLYPDRHDALHWAAHVELLTKRYDRAESLLIASEEVGPMEAEIEYDLACIKALRGDAPAALAHFERAVDDGYRNWEWISKDPDLQAIRSNPRYAEILGAHGR